MKKIFSMVLLCVVISFASCKKEDTISVDRITLNKPELILTKGTSEVLIASISPENADNQNVVWSSIDETVAKVSGKGEVTALKVGTTTIVASTVDGGKIAPCALRVTPESTVVSFYDATVETFECPNTGIVEIPISIPEGMKGNITCKIDATDGTAVSTGNDWDYKLKTTEVKIASTTKEGKIIVELNDSYGMKEDRTFKLKITMVSSDCNTEEVTVSPTLAECEVIIKKLTREATFEKAVITVDQQTASLDFGLCLTGPTTRDVTITFQPKAGATAIEGTHFRFNTHQITIKKGETIGKAILTVIKQAVPSEVDLHCKFEITEVTGNIDLVQGAICELTILKSSK